MNKENYEYMKISILQANPENPNENTVWSLFKSTKLLVELTL